MLDRCLCSEGMCAMVRRGGGLLSTFGGFGMLRLWSMGSGRRLGGWRVLFVDSANL